MATEEELIKNNDDCAICWDSMAAARKLPCGHLFHKYGFSLDISFISNSISHCKVLHLLLTTNNNNKKKFVIPVVAADLE